jgi:uncharacterized protein
MRHDTEPAMTADRLIARFGLQPHPEGGWFRRVYTSTTAVQAGARQRPALTAIVYLLKAGERSHWHRVASDELWHFYAGAPLQLLLADPELREVRVERLGPVALGLAPMQAVPARHWQAAQAGSGSAGFSLVGCTVAPGFDFADFDLLADDTVGAAHLRTAWPQYRDWL